MNVSETLHAGEPLKGKVPPNVVKEPCLYSNGFAHTEVIHIDNPDMDLAEVLVSTDKQNQGWRIYYQEHQSASLEDLFHSPSWFSLRANGPDSLGVYFPASSITGEHGAEPLLKAIGAYFTAVGGFVETPEEKTWRLSKVHLHDVPNPITGQPESSVSLALHERGGAKINT